MYYFDNSKIGQHFSIHKVGNKYEGELLRISKNKIVPTEELEGVLSKYFLSAFKSQEYYHLYHEVDLSLNEVYSYVSKIFANPETLWEQSVNLAKHLYEQSIHPKIKSGEFYTVYFKDCIIDGETVDAVGLFKSENKDTFLKVFPNKTEDGFEIESEQGININKLDKGCLIFNTEKENGYVVAVVDNTNKGIEAQYWIDDFLHVRQRNDEYFNTKNMMSMCKEFVKNEFSNQFESNAVQRDAIIQDTLNFLKTKDNFDFEEFTNEVIRQPEVIESFNNFKNTYQEKHDIEFANNFEISDSAVKKQQRSFKSVIKLDKNFHIYIHGDREKIQLCEDENGKFYKIYFDKED
jgi:hypothetical protein